MFENLSRLLDRLQQADFSALVLEPILYLGIFFGLISFCVGFFLNDKRARITGALIIALSCFTAYPHLKLTQKAGPRISATSPWSGGQVKIQQQRRQSTRWVFYSMGALALLALVSGGNLAKYGGFAVIAGGLGVMFFAVWLHMKECEIYHPYIKHGASTRGT